MQTKIHKLLDALTMHLQVEDELMTDVLERHAASVERVSKGIVALDEIVPLWWDRVDTDILNMGLIQRCVVGQVCGIKSAMTWDDYVQALGSLGIYGPGSEYGFAYPSDRPYWVAFIDYRKGF